MNRWWEVLRDFFKKFHFVIFLNIFFFLIFTWFLFIYLILKIFFQSKKLLNEIFNLFD
jgi:hypothetical protein